MESPLTKADWLRAARRALLRGGVGAVRVERLATDLGVTKGSFYWHFAGRPQLLDALLSEWEAEADLLIGAIGASEGHGLQPLLLQLAENVRASEEGEVPSDAAIFAWAAVDPAIAARVQAAEEERVGLLAALIGNREKAELAYMAYLGFILRRRHSGDASAAFGLVAKFVESLVGTAAAKGGLAAGNEAAHPLLPNKEEEIDDI
jgi:AcrR family transcriptional regulator